MKASDYTILVIDDEPDITDLLKDILEDEHYQVLTAANAEDGDRAYQQHTPDLVLLDIWMPDRDGISLLENWYQQGLTSNVVMMSGHGTIETAVQATKLGAFDFIEKPISVAKLLITVTNALKARSLSQTNQDLIKQLNPPVKIIGQNAEIKGLREKLVSLKDKSLPILFLGASGVGKETCARFLHQQSSRQDKPFIVINTDSAHPEKQITTIFGDNTELGLLSLADGGTIFVDEVSDLTLEVQQRFTNMLQSHQYQRGSQLVDAQMQLCFATRHLVEHSLANGDLDESLYYAINALTLKVPKLSEYREDVPELLRYFSYYFVDREQLPLREFSMPAQNFLRQYDWPGNIAELKNYVQRVLAIGTTEEVSLEEAQSFLDNEYLSDDPQEYYVPVHLPLRDAREAFEKAYFFKQLAACEGNVAKLAERAGMERTNLYRKLKSLGIQYKN